MSEAELDHHKAMTGPDLVKFVDYKLFPYLADFKQKSIDNPKSIEYKIGEIFSELSNKVKSGCNLREIIEMTDELPLGSSKDKHELSHLFGTKIKNMGNAGRNGGQYYTPRPLIRAMIEVIDPKIGKKIYDAACGSAGFLCESYEYLYNRMEKNTANLKTLQEKTLYGEERKNLAYIIGNCLPPLPMEHGLNGLSRISCAMSLSCCAASKPGTTRAVAEEASKLTAIPIGLPDSWFKKYPFWRSHIFQSFQRLFNENPESQYPNPPWPFPGAGMAVWLYAHLWAYTVAGFLLSSRWMRNTNSSGL